MTPQRIQLRRAKGWRMPENTVKVDRSTKWGNPFKIGHPFARRRMADGGGEITGVVADAEHAIQLFRRFIPLELQIAAHQELRGKNLACWCREGTPCHADVLLEIANMERSENV